MAHEDDWEQWKPMDDAVAASRQAEEEEFEEEEKSNGGVRVLNLVRGYVLLFAGLGLLVWGVVPPTKAGALTMGGALIGFNPLFRAAVSGVHHG